ncbi:UPF0738 family protein [Neobacillus sp. K501]
MKRKIEIIHAELTDNNLLFQTNQSINELTPGEQILVDSENFSFIYLMEDQHDYIYIVIPEDFWPQLKVMLDRPVPVWIHDGDNKKELTNFYEELDYIVSNIRGNSNYGVDMVTKVEETF